MTRLGIFVTHPIQYFAPMWRTLAAHPDLEPVVHFFSDHGVRESHDAGFGVPVRWDVPLLEGYEHRFVSRDGIVPQPRTLQFSRSPNADDVLEEGNFDWIMIHGYIHPFERQVLKAARRRGIPVLQRGEFSDIVSFGSSRGLAKHMVREAYLRWFYRQVSRFCYIGELARNHLRRRGVADEQMFFAPYSVDGSMFESFCEKIDGQAARRQLGIPREQTVLLFSGKMIPRKAPLLLIEALERLGAPPTVTLVMLGSGEMYEEVVRRGQQVLGERFLAPGFVNQSQLGPYFRAADLFVLPARSETWGLVVNEAMHCGLPVVVGSNVGCHRNLILPGQTGEVFEDGDVRDLAARLASLLDRPSQLAAMGQNAKSHIANYSTQVSAQGILAALDLADPVEVPGLQIRAQAA